MQCPVIEVAVEECPARSVTDQLNPFGKIHRDQCLKFKQNRYFFVVSFTMILWCLKYMVSWRRPYNASVHHCTGHSEATLVGTWNSGNLKWVTGLLFQTRLLHTHKIGHINPVDRPSLQESDEMLTSSRYIFGSASREPSPRICEGPAYQWVRPRVCEELLMRFLKIFFF